MVMPMVVLAILAIVSGLWNVNGQFSEFMGHHAEAPGFFGILTHSLPWISLIVAGSGILLAYAIYSAKWLSAERIGSIFKPLYTLFYRKYFFDELYENVIVKKVLIGGFFAGLQQIDTYGVDGVVNGVAKGAMAGGRAIRQAQTGQLQLYGLFIGIGILAIILCLYIFG
jgi:NADH-quinone oxidoreductase subunit L